MLTVPFFLGEMLAVPFFFEEKCWQYLYLKLCKIVLVCIADHEAKVLWLGLLTSEHALVDTSW